MTGRPGQTRPLVKKRVRRGEEELRRKILGKGKYSACRGEKKGKGKGGKYLKKENISPTLEKKNGEGKGIAHISHDCHDRRWCPF